MILIQKGPGKCLLRHFRTRKTPFQAIKTRSLKRRKIDIFSKGVNPWFVSKNGDFSNFFFQVIQARKMSFTIFQNDKNAILGYKTRSSKSRKIDIFPKWLTHFFLGNISQENVFYDILERKNAFLGYKNKKFEKSKNGYFFKGLTYGFCPKMTIFRKFFLRQYRPGKFLLRYSRTKKTLSRLQKKTRS